ncbi:putative Zinc finger, SWIM-type [Rosa chinensis]|uniref:Putative Zinc finger, SWIM-type n=1 Tax=Rosa chinensis TaxID=74649 RepID=A0A2P6Q025_ROSCH|nr:putative Zinc finger, SWIM-type [Rosa chinensis]
MHRSSATFFILGVTGIVYTAIITSYPKCSCPNPVTPCKHLLFAYIQVLGLSAHDKSFREGSFSHWEWSTCWGVTRCLNLGVEKHAAIVSSAV